MDLDEFRTILSNSGVNIWRFIETAIKVASLDYGDEFISHRDGIVAKLYANCPNCDNDTKVRASSGDDFVGNDVFEAGFEVEEEEEEGNDKRNSPLTPVSNGGDEVDDDEEEEGQVKLEEMLVDDVGDEDEYDEEKRIMFIKEQIGDPDKSEDSLIDLLQTLADMEITFKALQETDIGRHVNKLRKHPSNDVKQLVKLLVRKWKDLVDEWVKSNTPGEARSPTNLIDGALPQQNVSKHQQNGHTQVPDFGYSPNPHNGSSGIDKSEYKPKAIPARAPPPRRDPPAKPIRTASPVSAPPINKQKQVAVDAERLASARKRLQANYKEAQNAKKQRTIQVMEINELPKGKAKNSYFGKNKGGFHRH